MGKAKEELMKIEPVLNASAKARAMMKVFSRKIRFDLTDEEKPFIVEIENSLMQVKDNGEGVADIVATGSGEEFYRVMTAGLDVTHPIARGQLVITKGKISEMTLLNRILWATKRE